MAALPDRPGPKPSREGIKHSRYRISNTLYSLRRNKKLECYIGDSLPAAVLCREKSVRQRNTEKGRDTMSRRLTSVFLRPKLISNSDGDIGTALALQRRISVRNRRKAERRQDMAFVKKQMDGQSEKKLPKSLPIGSGLWAKAEAVGEARGPAAHISGSYSERLKIESERSEQQIFSIAVGNGDGQVIEDDVSGQEGRGEV